MTATDSADRPMLDYDRLQLGEVFGPIVYRLTPAKLDLYREAVSDPEAIFATIASKDYANLLRTRYILGDVVNARHDTRYYHTPRPGGEIRTTGRLVDRYVKRDRQFITVETISTDEAGDVLVESRTTLALGRPKPAVE